MKMTIKEQQEFSGMEAAILKAENEVQARQTAMEGAATAGHAALAEACRLLETSQHAVEQLYARWQELGARGGI